MKKISVVPRLGPPTNLRRGGAHRDLRRAPRRTLKQRIEREEN